MFDVNRNLRPVGLEYGTVELVAGRVIAKAHEGTDAFVSPDGRTSIDRLPGARLALPDAPVAFATRVFPDLKATFDAGALMLRTDQGKWAKLAFELSPQGRETAVSVVTNETSDDANGPAFDADALFLRIYRSGNLTAFHVSSDGEIWDLLRLFNLPGQHASIDLIAQSPTGNGCMATFTDFHLTQREIPDLRDGS